MKITVIHGQSHKGSTYHIAHSLAEKLGGEITEFFMPRDLNDLCCGCTTCFFVSETRCPHYSKLAPITKAIDEADVIILASPVYVLHATAGMKNLLDHYGWRFMPHRPEEKMFSKQAVCIATAVGAGMKGTLREMSDSLMFWGVPVIYRYGVALHETDWERVSPQKKRSIERRLDEIADKLWVNKDKVRVGAKTKALFAACRELQFVFNNDKDKRYWYKKGWFGKNRPWKNNSEEK